ncbi:hypothetical protein BJX70DRAFT_403707 [Aspergillus crustosus]
MGRIVLSVFALFYIASSVSAWSFTWTNEEGKSYIEHQSDPVDCRQIEQAEGEGFRWNPEEDGLSIWLFENDECAGNRAGYSPPSIWNHPASSRDLLSFRVAPEDEDGDPETSTTTFTSTTTGSTSSTASTTPNPTEFTPTPTSTATETPTSGPSDSEDSSDSSVPASAVAGGVVGGVAGVAAIGGLFFFLGRRRRRSPIDPEPRESGPDNGTNPSTGSRPPTAPAPDPTSPVPPTPMYGAAASGTGTAPYDPDSVEGKQELDSAPVYQLHHTTSSYADEIAKQPYSPLDGHRPPAAVMAELQGDSVMVEMSDTHRLNELEGDAAARKR